MRITLNKILEGIPDREIYADTSDYKFKKYDANLTLDEVNHKVDVKLRGNTKQHWIYKKKSYTIRPQKNDFFLKTYIYL